jgi:hypothetical protein
MAIEKNKFGWSADVELVMYLRMHGLSNRRLCKMLNISIDELNALVKGTSEEPRLGSVFDVFEAHRLLMDGMSVEGLCKKFRRSWSVICNLFLRFGMTIPTTNFNTDEFVCRECGILLKFVLHRFGGICDCCWFKEWKDDPICAKTFGWNIYDRNWYLAASTADLVSWPISAGKRYVHPFLEGASGL